MKSLTIEVNPREGNGSSASRRLRRQGQIPSVVYSHGEPSVMTSLVYKDFMRLASTSRSSQLFVIKSTDSKLNGRNAIVKEIQRSYINDAVLHVDFQAIRDDQVISVRVPLKFTGESIGVKADGGLLSIASHDIGVRCLPKLIPEEIEINISELKIGDNISAGDVKLGQGVELDGEPDETIVSVAIAKVMEVEAPKPAEGAVAAADGAAAPADGAAPAEGAAPAADAKDAKAPAKDAKKDAPKK